MSGVKLKPCPFCGSHLLGRSDTEMRGCAEFVTCLNCGVNGPVEMTKAAATRAWNRRPGPSRGRRTRGK